MSFRLPELLIENPDQGYLQKITKLQKDINAVKCRKSTNNDITKYFEEICILFARFAQSYIMSWEFWDYFLNRYPRYGYEMDLAFVDALKKYQFFHPRTHTPYSDEGWEEKIISNPRREFRRIFMAENQGMIDQNNVLRKSVKTLEQSLKYPHCDIDAVWALYELESATFPPKSIAQTYQKMSELYRKIRAAEGNIYEWFHLLMEVGDDGFVAENVEFRLGKELTNKKLWRFYIKFWKQRDTKKMLHLLSKFCRIFVDDKAMLKVYEKEAKKSGDHLSVPWINPFPFERHDKNAIVQLQVALPKKNAKKEKSGHPIQKYFTSDNEIIQIFPFQFTTMRYILDNADLRLQAKMPQLCKYFSRKNPTLLCYKFQTRNFHNQNPIHFWRHSIAVDSGYLPILKLENLFITTVFEFNNNARRMALKHFIPKISKCTAKFIKIHHQNIRFEDLKILIGHGNVEELELIDVKILDKNEEQVIINEILLMVPKAKKLKFHSSSSSTISSTFETLRNIKFDGKLDLLELNDIPSEHVNPDVIYEFLKSNISPQCNVAITFAFSIQLPFMQISETMDMYENLIINRIKSDFETFIKKPNIVFDFIQT